MWVDDASAHLAENSKRLCWHRGYVRLVYGPGHPKNIAHALPGKVKSSFRAEVRAILQVFSKAAVKTRIRCDCKGVVKLVTDIFENKGYDKKHNDADLLEAINSICVNIPAKRIIEWMPAHLDEEK